MPRLRMSELVGLDGEPQAALPPSRSVKVHLPLRHPNEVLHNHMDKEGVVYVGYSETDPNQHLWACPKTDCLYTRTVMCMKKMIGRECSTCRSLK